MDPWRSPLRWKPLAAAGPLLSGAIRWSGVGLMGVMTAAGATDAAAPPALPPTPLSPSAESPAQALQETDRRSSDPQVIQRLRARGVQAEPGGTVGRFLQLWRLEIPHQRPTLVMTTVEGHLIRGQVYDAQGQQVINTDAALPIVMDPVRRRAEGFAPLTEALSTASTAGAVPASKSPGISTGRSVWDQLSQATVIEEGTVGAPLVYIFFDPYCAYCRQQWLTLRAKVAGGHLRVRWAPVAVLSQSQTDPGVVQGLLRDPKAEILADWMKNRRSPSDDSEITRAALARNRALFETLRIPSVPVLLYKDASGELVTRVGVTPL